MSRITEAFQTAFASGGTQTAVVSRHGKRVFRRSFAELQSDVQRMTAYFRSKGIRRGMRILAFASPSYDLCVCMIAALQTGAPIMYVDIWAKQDSLRRVFADYRPDTVLVSGRTRFLRPFFREIGKIRHVIRTDRYRNLSPAFDTPAPPQEDTPALLTMTTGSTGRPKIAVRTHSDLMHQLELIGKNLQAEERETVLTTSYIYVFANILNGFTTVMPMLNLGMSSTNRLNRTLALFRDEPVTMILTTPDFCLRANPDFPLLRSVYCGGAILNLHEACVIRRKFRNCSCTLIYGSTECNIIASADLTDYIRTLKSTCRAMLGKPVNGVRVRLTEEGEVMVASAALLAHYLIQDSEKETDTEGTLWHRTGDIAAQTDGMLYYRGKKGYFVTSGNRQIYNNEIEQAVTVQNRLIPKCAVLQQNGTVHIWIQQSEPDEAGILAVLRRFGIPDPVLHRTKKIPCDVKHHTKIDYKKLKEQLG